MSGPVRVRLRVRLAETDAQGVAYYGSFLTYLELGRVEVLRRAGVLDLVRRPADGGPPHGAFYVVRAVCDYRAPARFDDELELEVVPERIGRSSFGLRYALTRVADGMRIADAEDVVVHVDGSGRRAPLPEALRAYLLRLHRPPVPGAQGGPLAGVGRIALGSAQPAKVEAARAVFDRLAPHAELVAGAAAGAEEQPWEEEAALRGAERRAEEAMAASGADLGVGMEDAVVATPAGPVVSGWCVALGRDGRRGAARTAGFVLPPALARAVEAGEPLAGAAARLAGGPAGRGGAGDAAAGAGGTVGALTAGLVTRRDRWQAALVLALLPWLRPELYPPPGLRAAGDARGRRGGATAAGREPGG